jgi:hypothetical protein
MLPELNKSFLLFRIALRQQADLENGACLFHHLSSCALTDSGTKYDLNGKKEPCRAFAAISGAAATPV